jgi:NAD(P)-dependent dehydrogenase (short-subunit alcohol dehydrogenase family)
MDGDTNRSLVVGGSGMLSGLCLTLALTGDDVSVVARRHQPLDRLVALSPTSNITALPLDYTRRADLRRVLEDQVSSRGPFDRTICWTHDEQSTEAPLLFAAYTSRQFFQVLSSSYADPAKPAHLMARRQEFEQAFPSIDYHTVVLGFGGEVGGRSRWLSHGEISNGVLRALVEPGLDHEVGRVAP